MPIRYRRDCSSSRGKSRSRVQGTKGKARRTGQTSAGLDERHVADVFIASKQRPRRSQFAQKEPATSDRDQAGQSSEERGADLVATGPALLDADRSLVRLARLSMLAAGGAAFVAHPEIVPE